MAMTLQAVSGAVKGALKNVGSKVEARTTKAFKALEKEGKLGPVLHEQCLGALAAMKARDKSLEKTLERAYAYAVLPNVSKANLVLGSAYGIGEVFEGGRVTGYAGLVEVTLGVAVGGETFDVIITFENAEVFKRFKQGKYGFAANAAIAILKAKAEATHGFGAGTKIYVNSEGGLQIVTAIGIQRFIYRPAALGRLRTDDKHTSLTAEQQGALEKEKPPPMGDGGEQARSASAAESAEAKPAEEPEESESRESESTTDEKPEDEHPKTNVFSRIARHRPFRH